MAILYRTRDAEAGTIDKLPVLCDEEPHDVVEILVLTPGICLFDDRFQPPVDHIEQGQACGGASQYIRPGSSGNGPPLATIALQEFVGFFRPPRPRRIVGKGARRESFPHV